MLLTKSSPRSEDRTLIAACCQLQGDPPQAIPFLVWLLENPDSPCALPGNVSLVDHDRLHCILDRGFTAEDEAFIVGFSMGNDRLTHWIHVLILKVAAFIFYPKKYRFSFTDMQEFDRGFLVGRNLRHRNLNRGMPVDWDNRRLGEIRQELNLVI
jgi:hypothetical protein